MVYALSCSCIHSRTTEYLLVEQAAQSGVFMVFFYLFNTYILNTRHTDEAVKFRGKRREKDKSSKGNVCSKLWNVYFKA